MGIHTTTTIHITTSPQRATVIHMTIAMSMTGSITIVRGTILQLTAVHIRTCILTTMTMAIIRTALICVRGKG
ncbi:MAG: hypothetical protein BA865_00310 [Desulfobacterales bacterium S5133MH4]|nr:MAG: hypothetical protein BA865_00310 [Desulfobacterales bacterium S5133MH4]